VDGNQDRSSEVVARVTKAIEELRALEINHLGEWPDFDDGTFFHTPDATLASPYLRDDYIIAKSKGKKLLHFGFADAPFTAERIKSGELLHLKLRSVTELLWGADIDSMSIKTYEDNTGDPNNWTLDICKPIKHLERYNKNFDVVIFGEILEHLLNPGIALNNLRNLCEINSAKLIITTPNAFNSAGFVAALIGNEVVHPEHYYYYSPVTLKRLLSDCGFKDIDISFYSGANTASSPGITFPGLIAECGT